MVRRPLVFLLLASLLVAGCGGQDGSPAPGSSVTGASSLADPGWRWESYGGVEVQVPEEWVGTTAGVAGYPAWCAAGDEGAPSPGVNRGALGIMPAIACGSNRPASSYAQGLELGSQLPVGRRDLAGRWAVETIEVAGVAVAVTSDDPRQMQQVLASARPVRDGVDVHGCAVDSDLRREGARPASGALPSPDEVVAVTACRYLTPVSGSEMELPAPLLASLRWNDNDAAELVEAITSAPAGSGPDDDNSCAASQRLGEELLVLQVDDGSDVQEVVVRYSGCGGHGVDDGTTTRRLTGDLLQRLLVGPLTPTYLSGVVANLTR